MSWLDSVPDDKPPPRSSWLDEIPDDHGKMSALSPTYLKKTSDEQQRAYDSTGASHVLDPTAEEGIQAVQSAAGRGVLGMAGLEPGDVEGMQAALSNPHLPANSEEAGKFLNDLVPWDGKLPIVSDKGLFTLDTLSNLTDYVKSGFDPATPLIHAVRRGAHALNPQAFDEAKKEGARLQAYDEAPALLNGSLPLAQVGEQLPNIALGPLMGGEGAAAKNAAEAVGLGGKALAPLLGKLGISVEGAPTTAVGKALMTDVSTPVVDAAATAARAARSTAANAAEGLAIRVPTAGKVIGGVGGAVKGGPVGAYVGYRAGAKAGGLAAGGLRDLADALRPLVGEEAAPKIAAEIAPDMPADVMAGESPASLEQMVADVVMGKAPKASADMAQSYDPGGKDWANWLGKRDATPEARPELDAAARVLATGTKVDRTPAPRPTGLAVAAEPMAVEPTPELRAKALDALEQPPEARSARQELAAAKWDRAGNPESAKPNARERAAAPFAESESKPVTAIDAFRAAKGDVIKIREVMTQLQDMGLNNVQIEGLKQAAGVDVVPPTNAAPDALDELARVALANEAAPKAPAPTDPLAPPHIDALRALEKEARSENLEENPGATRRRPGRLRPRAAALPVAAHIRAIPRTTSIFGLRGPQAAQDGILHFLDDSVGDRLPARGLGARGYVVVDASAIAPGRLADLDQNRFIRVTQDTHDGFLRFAEGSRAPRDVNSAQVVFHEFGHSHTPLRRTPPLNQMPAFRGAGRLVEEATNDRVMSRVFEDEFGVEPGLDEDVEAMRDIFHLVLGEHLALALPDQIAALADQIFLGGSETFRASHGQEPLLTSDEVVDRFVAGVPIPEIVRDRATFRAELRDAILANGR